MWFDFEKAEQQLITVKSQERLCGALLLPIMISLLWGEVDEGVQEWMHSTGDTIEVSLPALHDPSHKQMKDTLWFPVSSAKKEGKEKEA